jgi:hypothetical protein
MPHLTGPARHLSFMNARISAFVGRLAAVTSAPLTKMLISLRINKGNIWLAACFYRDWLHKANYFNE